MAYFSPTPDGIAELEEIGENRTMNPVHPHALAGDYLFKAGPLTEGAQLARH